MPSRIDPAQTPLLEDHWYALVSAAPVPENGEAVNVALVFGNGRAFHLDYIESLPRLSCLVTSSELRVFASVLEGCRHRVERGIDPLELSSLLGPQLFLQPARALYASVADDLVARLRRRFLASPKDHPLTDEAALVHRSRQRLDRLIKRVSFPSSLVDKEVSASKLYEGKIPGLGEHRIPKLSRALRGFGRDLLVDSVVIERGFDARDVREIASRISQAFYVYNRNREAIRQRTNRDLRTTGILYEPPKDSTADLMDLFEITREDWRNRQAHVITGSEDEIAEELSGDAAWVQQLGRP